MLKAPNICLDVNHLYSDTQTQTWYDFEPDKGQLLFGDLPRLRICLPRRIIVFYSDVD